MTAFGVQTTKACKTRIKFVSQKQKSTRGLPTTAIYYSTVLVQLEVQPHASRVSCKTRNAEWNGMEQWNGIEWNRALIIVILLLSSIVKIVLAFQKLIL